MALAINGIGRLVAPNMYVVEDFPRLQAGVSEAERDGLVAGVRAWGVSYLVMAPFIAGLGLWLVLACPGKPQATGVPEPQGGRDDLHTGRDRPLEHHLGKQFP